MILTECADKFSGIKKVQFGCGRSIEDGFLNVDGDFRWLSPDMRNDIVYNYVDRASPKLLQHDLRERMPEALREVEVIYHCHFLEHLPIDLGAIFLTQCYRLLAPGGVMRLVVPDFELWCKKYVAKDKDYFQWYKRSYLGVDNPYYVTNGQIFTGMLYNWGHVMAYDYETLVHLLKSIGFINISQSFWGKSNDAKFAGIELIEDGENQRRFESLVIECERGTSLTRPKTIPSFGV
jgi:predicted SAM-dependent methyltransferase